VHAHEGGQGDLLALTLPAVEVGEGLSHGVWGRPNEKFRLRRMISSAAFDSSAVLAKARRLGYVRPG
jgi:hypothetical protein